MGQVRRQPAGTKWHIGADGKPARCTATVRACPYLTHYKTEEDALDPRRRMFPHTVDGAPYSVTVGFQGEENAGELEATPLRGLADKAREHYIKTGQPLRHPRGSFTVDFGGGRKVEIQRENFPAADRNPREAATRYYMTYWHNAETYEVEAVEIQPGEGGAPYYTKMQSILQRFGTMARDAHMKEVQDASYLRESGGVLRGDELQEADPEYDRKLRDTVADAMKTIDHLEVLALGTEGAHRERGVDIFARDTPGLLDLEVNYATSALQPYDVVNSLKLHAQEDNAVRRIGISVTDELPGGERSWTITRDPDGSWYFSYVKGEMVYSNEITKREVEKVLSAVDFVMGDKFKDYPKQLESRKAFVRSLLTEVEPAVRNYEWAVGARVAETAKYAGAKNETPTPTAPPAPQGPAPQQPTLRPQEEKSSFKNKLFGLFS